MDREKILDIMRNLRTQREMKLLNEDLNNAKILESSENKPLNEVVNVKYIGTIMLEENINGEKVKKEKPVFVVMEKRTDKNGNSINVERYCFEDGEVIGGNNKNDSYNFIVLSEKYAGNQDLLEQLQEIENSKEILDLNETEDKRRKSIAKAIGIDEKNMSIDEIDADKELDKNGKKEEKEEDKIKSRDVSKLNTREETSLNTYLKGKTLGNLLGLKEHGIKGACKIAVVTTSGLESATGKIEKTSNKYSFVAILNNGDAVPLGEDILTLDTSKGTNPAESQTTINNDGRVNKETVNSSFKIVNGNGNEYLQVGYDETSGLELKYTTKERGSNDNLALELETQRTFPQSSAVRQYSNTKGAGTDEVDKMNDKANKHNEHDKELENGSSIEMRDIDENPDNDSHTHDDKKDKRNENNIQSIEETYIGYCVRKILDTPIDLETYRRR